MSCEFDRNRINMYIDGELSEDEMRHVERHLDSCTECKALFDELTGIREMLLEVEELDLPNGYESELHQKLAKENKAVEGQKFAWKRWTAVAAVFMVAFVSYNVWKPLQYKMNVGQSDMAIMEESAEAPAEMKAEYAMDNAEYGDRDTRGMSVAGVESEVQNQQADGRKIIRNGYINLEVEEFDEVYDGIVMITEASGGFVQNSSTGKRHYYAEGNEDEHLLHGNLSLRIPENSFLEVYNEIKELGEVSDSSIGGNDITFQYNDISSQIDNLKIQELRLREIMEKAENVEELLQVERELNRVRTEIDRLTGMIKNWDNLVSYSTISVSVTEVVPKSTEIEGFKDDFWENAKKGFVKSINTVVIMAQGLFVWIISVIPFVFVLGLIGIAIAMVVRKKRRRKTK